MTIQSHVKGAAIIPSQDLCHVIDLFTLWIGWLVDQGKKEEKERAKKRSFSLFP